MGASSSTRLENERLHEALLVSYEQYQLEQQSKETKAALRKEQREIFRGTNPASLSQYQEIFHKSKQPMEHKPWEPNDIETDPETETETESELMKKMQNAIVELENSVFYSKFLQQIQTPPFLNHFFRVLGSEPKFQIVSYECFHPLTSESSLTKLAFLLLIKRDFNDRIGEIQVFESKFNQTEVRVLEDLGCLVLRVDENLYRKVSKPTLFFLPHRGFEEYDRLLRANWKPENLNRMILLGNSLKQMKDTEVSITENFRLLKSPFKNGRFIQISRYLMCIPRFVTEIPLTGIHDCDKISEKFLSQTWHFFIWFDDVPKMKLLFKPTLVVVAGIFYYLYYKYRKCKRLHEQRFEERNYSSFFRIGWLFRRYRMRCFLEEKKKKKKRMIFYVSRTLVLPWFVGLPRKKWAEIREVSKGVMTWMKENDDKISHRQLDILIEAWF